MRPCHASHFDVASQTCALRGRPLALAHVEGAVERDELRVVAHADAWPFQHAVSAEIAPDYKDVICDPVDLSLIASRLKDGFYASLEMFLADMLRICQNCRLYNGENNEYWECANRLEKFIRARCGEISCVRRFDSS